MKRKMKIPIRVRQGTLVVASLLLFLPDLHIIDFSPDLIAYLLLLSVFSPYAVLNDHMAEAVRLLEHMALISGAQIVSVFFVFGFLSVNAAEQPTAILLCCFVLGFFKLKEGWVLCRHLCEGLIHLDTVYDGTMFCARKAYRTKNLFGRPKRRTRPPSRYNVTELACRSCQGFLVVKTVLNTLPEFAALSDNPYDEMVFNWYRYVGLFRGAAMLLLFFIGLVWLIRTLRYIRAISRDRAYYERLSAAYEEQDRLHPERRIRKTLRTSFLLLTLFAVFTMDFMVDNINLLPDALGAVMLLLFMWLLRPYLTKRKLPWVIGITYGALSVVNYVVSTLFFTRYRPESILRSVRIREAYVPVQILSVLESVLLLATLVAVLRMLYEIIDRYTGYEIESTYNYSKEDKLREEHLQMKRSLIPVCVFGVLTSFCGAAYIFLRPTVNFVWMLGVLIPAVFAVLLRFRLNELNDRIDSKYMLM